MVGQSIFSNDLNMNSLRTSMHMAMHATHWNQSPIYGYLYIYHQAVYS